MILIDTGPIVAAALSSEQHHDACAHLFSELRLAQQQMLVVPTVLAEAGYMLRTVGTPRQEVEFLKGVADGDFDVVNLTPVDLDRIAELTAQYIDHPLGVTDASIIAVAERLKITEIATINPRDFRAVRPRHAGYFTLLPESVNG